MKNKEDPSIRNRIHTFKDLKKQGNYPIDRNFCFEREGIENYVKNSEDIPGSVKKASSVFYISDPDGLSNDKLTKVSNSYDLIIRDVTKDYRSLSFEDLSNANFSIFNSYSSLVEEFEPQATHTSWLSKSPREISTESVLYESNETFDNLLNDFINRNSLSLKSADSIPVVVFLLKCFDVVHCYGLESGSKAEDHATFGMHFLGLITLKDLY